MIVSSPTSRHNYLNTYVAQQLPHPPSVLGPSLILSSSLSLSLSPSLPRSASRLVVAVLSIRWFRRGWIIGHQAHVDGSDSRAVCEWRVRTSSIVVCRGWKQRCGGCSDTMEGLQDAIQDAQYMGEVCDDTPHPVVPLKLPPVEEMSSFLSTIRVSRPNDVTFPGILGQDIGFWFFAKFVERNGDKDSLDFLTEVENFRVLTNDALRHKAASRIAWRYSHRSSSEHVNTGDPQKTPVDTSILFRHGRLHRFAALRHFEAQPSRLKAAKVLLDSQAKLRGQQVGMEAGGDRQMLLGLMGVCVDKVLGIIAPSEESEADDDQTVPQQGRSASRSSRIPSRHKIFFEDTKLSPNLFDGLQEAVLERVRATHYEKFKASEEFTSFLQYKFLSEQKCGENDFAVFRKLGRGGFGAVYACKKLITGNLYAMKVMDKKRIKSKKALHMIMNERSVLARLNSPFVVCLAYSFQTTAEIVFMLDLMQGGDLQFHLQAGLFSKERTQFYGAQILLALEHMHNLGIVYRDLKPENILLHKDGNCRVSDMGLACMMPKGGLTGRCGTRGYWAPEMLSKEKPYGIEVDWWSYGVTLYTFLCGKSPFRTDAAKALKPDKNESIDYATLTMEVMYPSEVFDAETTDILSKLLIRNPSLRLGHKGADEIKSCSFFKDVDWGMLENGTFDPPFVPDRDINAHSQEDIGSFEKIKKVQLTEEDIALFKKVEFASSSAVQREFVNFLRYEEDHGPIVLQGNSDSGCCTIL